MTGILRYPLFKTMALTSKLQLAYKDVFTRHFKIVTLFSRVICK
jgi:hypothetical protein